MYKWKDPAISDLPQRLSAHLLPNSRIKIGIMPSIILLKRRKWYRKIRGSKVKWSPILIDFQHKAKRQKS